MPLKTHHDDQPSLNLTPMIDVVFLLIIFFMVATKFSEMEQSLVVNVPEIAQPGPMTSAPRKHVVNIYADGQVRHNHVSVTLAELTDRLSDARAQFHDLRVMLRGDKQCSFDRVAQVLAACREAKITQIDINTRLARSTAPATLR